MAKILIVNGDRGKQLDIRQALLGESHEVVFASDWTEALLHLRQKPDVALVSSNVPGVTGTKIIETFKRFYPKLKTVLLTEGAEAAALKMAYNCKADAWLVEEDIGRLASVVTDLLTT